MQVSKQLISKLQTLKKSNQKLGQTDEQKSPLLSPPLSMADKRFENCPPTLLRTGLIECIQGLFNYKRATKVHVSFSMKIKIY